MTKCPICGAEVPAESRFCLSCGAALTPEAATETIAAPRKPPSSSSSDEGRCPAGTVLGERYRVLGLWAFHNALGGRKVLKGDFLEG